MNLNKNLLFSIVVLLIASCVAPVKLTSSWTNKDAKTINAPKIMIMAIAKKPYVKKLAEQTFAKEFKKAGENSIVSIEYFKQDSTKIDSITMVNILRENKVDYLLTNAVVSLNKDERYVPGNTVTSPVYYSPYQTYPFGYNSYYGYYGYRNNYYYENMNTSGNTEGYTDVNVEVYIESNLYNVNSGELIWSGQTKSLTDEPSKILFSAIAKNILLDLEKNNLLTIKPKK